MTTTVNPLTLFGVNDRDTITLATEVARRFAEPGLIDEDVTGVELEVELYVDKVGTRPKGLVAHAHWIHTDDVDRGGELWFASSANIIWITASTDEGAFTRRLVGRGASMALAADQAADEAAEAIVRFAKGGVL